jgi:hypothetical protein
VKREDSSNRWFIDLKDMNTLWEPHRKEWRLPMKLDGGALFGPQAEKALTNGWCKRTADLRRAPVQSVENLLGLADVRPTAINICRIRMAAAARST